MTCRQRGYALIELTVGLAIAGAAGLVLWQLIPQSRQVAEGDAVLRQLDTVQSSVEGFAMSRHRLPCADTDNDGLENCAGGAIGTVPWRTLQLGRADGTLRYGLYRSGTADLGATSTAYRLNLPAQPVVNSSTYDPNTVNGLDLCHLLRLATSAPNNLSAGGVPAAFVLAHPGANGRFDGLNASTFDLPGRAQTDSYDDRMAATGLGELSARLNCPRRLGEVTAATRSAFAAYDLARNAQMFLDFRNFAYEIRQTNTHFAEASLAIASLDLLIAIGNQAASISIAANSAGVGAGTIAKAVITLVAATAAVVAASVTLASAVTAEAKAKAQAEQAVLLNAQALADRNAAVQAAYSNDLKGLLP